MIGGWAPSDYIKPGEGEVPIQNVYKRKNGHEYMDISKWAERKWGDPNARDKELGNIFLSARMMKYHPLITKAQEDLQSPGSSCYESYVSRG